MAYATQTQLTYAAGGSIPPSAADRFVSLTDWNGDGSPDADVIQEAQARADGWIDSYLRLRYSTPIANPSDTLIRLSADEAVYWLRSKRGMLGPEDIDQRKDRERQLADMRDGKLRPDEPTPAKSTAVAATMVTNTSCVSRCGLKGMW